MTSIADIIGNPIFWLICAFFVLALIYSLRSYIKALGTSLFFDYGADAGLSFGDELLGIGITGLDVGDWLGGVLMFLKYRQQVGTGWALLFLAEAANFGLSSLSLLFPFSFLFLKGLKFSLIYFQLSPLWYFSNNTRQIRFITPL